MGPTTLKSKPEFDKVFAEHNGFSRNGLGFHFRGVIEEGFRYGVIIPKRYGKAVDRNKVRRRLREIVRRCNKLPERTEIVICVYKSCKSLAFDILHKTLFWGFDLISRRVQNRPRAVPSRSSFGPTNEP